MIAYNEVEHTLCYTAYAYNWAVAVCKERDKMDDIAVVIKLT